MPDNSKLPEPEVVQCYGCTLAYALKDLRKADAVLLGNCVIGLLRFREWARLFRGGLITFSLEADQVVATVEAQGLRACRSTFKQGAFVSKKRMLLLPDGDAHIVVLEFEGVTDAS